MEKGRLGKTSTTERWVLFAATLVSALASVEATALNVALPAIQADLDASGGQLLWLVDAYALTMAACILIAGSLGDLFGRKKVLTVGLVLFGIASWVCGYTHNVHLAIAARAVQGVGAACMVPLSLALVSAGFEPERRGWAIGTWLGLSTLGTVLGPLMGGILAEADMWRVIFYLNIPVAIIAAWVLASKVPESKGQSGSLDIAGAITILVGLSSLTYGFITAGEVGWTEIGVWLALAVGVLSIGAFLWVQKTAKSPMMPLELYASRTFAGANAMTFFIYGALAGILLFLPLVLVQVHGYSPVQAGLALLPMAGFIGAMSAALGKWADRHGERLPLTIGPLFVAAGFFWLSTVKADAVGYVADFLPSIALIGVGMGIVTSPITTAVMGAVPKERSGIASGVNNAVTRVSAVLAIAIMGSVLLARFRWSFIPGLEALELPEDLHALLLAESHNLANIQIPEEVPADTAAKVHHLVQQSFMAGFAQIAFHGVWMNLLSSIIAWKTIER